MKSISLFTLFHQSATADIALSSGEGHAGESVMTGRPDELQDTLMASLDTARDKDEEEQDQRQRNYYANYFVNLARTSSAQLYYKRCPRHNLNMSGYGYNVVPTLTTPTCSHTTWQKWGPSARKVFNPLRQPVHATVDLPGTVFGALAVNQGVMELDHPIWAKMNDLGISPANLEGTGYKSIQHEDQVRLHGPRSFLDSVHEFFGDDNKPYTVIHGKVVGSWPRPFLGFGRRGRKFNPSPAPMWGTYDYEVDQLIEVDRIYVPKRGWVQPVFTHADSYDDTQNYPMLQDNHHLGGSFNYVCIKGKHYTEKVEDANGQTTEVARFKPDCRDRRYVYHAGRTYMVVTSRNFYFPANNNVLMQVARGMKGETKPTDGMSALIGSSVINTTGVANGRWRYYPTKQGSSLKGSSLMEQVIHEQYKAHDKALRDGEDPDLAASDKLVACLFESGQTEEGCAMEVMGKSHHDAVTSMQPTDLKILRQLNEETVTTTAATISSVSDLTANLTILPRRSQEIRGILTLPRRWCRRTDGRWAGVRSLYPRYYGSVNENLFGGKYGAIFFDQPKQCHTRGPSLWALTVFKNAATLV